VRLAFITSSDQLWPAAKRSTMFLLKTTAHQNITLNIIAEKSY